MRNQLVTLILVLCSYSAYAGPYIELGVGAKFSHCDCTRFDNPIGTVAVGYQFRDSGFRIEAEHRSSIAEVDYGQNTVVIKYRWGGRD